MLYANTMPAYMRDVSTVTWTPGTWTGRFLVEDTKGGSYSDQCLVCSKCSMSTSQRKEKVGNENRSHKY